MPSAVRDYGLEQSAKTLLEKIGAADLAARISVFWNPRLKSTAGTASYKTFSISLNPALRPFGEKEIDQTLRHELAHLLARTRNQTRKISPHGAEWKAACALLGIPGETRCHRLPLPRTQKKRSLFYRCPSCSLIIARVKPLRRRAACLQCCRIFAAGKYDSRFELLPSPPPLPAPAEYPSPSPHSSHTLSKNL